MHWSGRTTHRLLYKSPGQAVFAPPDQFCAADPALAEGSLYSREFGFGSRHLGEAGPEDRGMVIPPGGSDVDLAEVRQSRSGPVYLRRVDLLSSLVHPHMDAMVQMWLTATGYVYNPVP